MSELTPDQKILRRVCIEEWRKVRSGAVELAAASYGVRLNHVASEVHRRTGINKPRCESAAHRSYNIVAHGHENPHYPLSEV